MVHFGVPTLRDILRQIPQDAEFHPEGNVWTHTRAVRRALDEALALLPDFQIDKVDRNLLRLAAWCHDLGKAHATIYRENRWIAPGHEKPKHLNVVLRQLGDPWRGMWRAGSFEQRKTFLYLCTRHMAVSDARGIDARIMRALRSSNRLRSRQAKLVIVLMVMDRLGTTRVSRVDDARIVAGAYAALRPQG
jgi:hypothetical protein